MGEDPRALILLSEPSRLKQADNTSVLIHGSHQAARKSNLVAVPKVGSSGTSFLMYMTVHSSYRQGHGLRLPFQATPNPLPWMRNR